MALDERSRHELFLRLEEVLGPRQAETLMEMMPPVGWADVATKRDLDALEQRMELRFEAIDHRFEAMDHRFEAMDHRFEAMDHKFEGLDHKFDTMDHKLEALEHKLVAVFRGELLAAVTAQTSVFSAQTRTLVFANIGAVLSTAALAFAAARLA
ncbi:MAG: hypothetical protein ACRD0C_11445 [Acidimicrobiia bacterium]